MTENVRQHLDTLLSRYKKLKDCEAQLICAYEEMERAYLAGGKLLIAGKGGSAADSEHMVGELMKAFILPRRLSSEAMKRMEQIEPELGPVLAKHLQGALPAIALDGHPALTTAYMNDCEPLLCFAQQVNGYGCLEDVLLAISTSGNSKNVLYAAVTAKAKGMRVIGLTGARESRLSALADVTIRVPETATYMIQELHLPVYHCLCLMLEERFFGNAEERV